MLFKRAQEESSIKRKKAQEAKDKHLANIMMHCKNIGEGPFPSSPPLKEENQ